MEVPDGIRNEDGLRQFIKVAFGKSANAWRDYQMAIDSAEEVDRPFEHPLFDLDDLMTTSDTVWILRRPLLEDQFPKKMKK